MRYITDAGHGWLEVSLADYPDAPEYGTGFGYQDVPHGVIYLEEDCEMGAFLRAHPEARDRITHTNYDGSAPIRRLPHNEKRMVWPSYS